MKLSISVLLLLAVVVNVVSATFSLKAAIKSNVKQVYPIPEPPSKTVSRVKFPLSQSGPVSVPVLSSHTIQVVPVAVDTLAQTAPQLITVEPSSQAVHFLFKSASSPLFVRQQHYSSTPLLHEVTRSQDQPHILRHEVVKPVVQEIRETIQPYRRITQEIKPVLEQIHVLVPKGQQRNQYPLLHPQPQSPQQPIVQQQEEETQQQVLEQSYQDPSNF